MDNQGSTAQKMLRYTVSNNQTNDHPQGTSET